MSTAEEIVTAPVGAVFHAPGLDHDDSYVTWVRVADTRDRSPLSHRGVIPGLLCTDSSNLSLIGTDVPLDVLTDMEARTPGIFRRWRRVGTMPSREVTT